ncbi:hypothetical protein JTL72_35545, partial [Pseudomonas aeruginosa]|nr:hypothetical protein [Pseudomonas aeruginosa]
MADNRKRLFAPPVHPREEPYRAKGQPPFQTIILAHHCPEKTTGMADNRKRLFALPPTPREEP